MLRGASSQTLARLPNVLLAAERTFSGVYHAGAITRELQLLEEQPVQRHGS